MEGRGRASIRGLTGVRRLAAVCGLEGTWVDRRAGGNDILRHGRNNRSGGKRREDDADERRLSGSPVRRELNARRKLRRGGEEVGTRGGGRKEVGENSDEESDLRIFSPVNSSTNAKNVLMGDIRGFDYLERVDWYDEFEEMVLHDFP
jgi:hypothetical protein